MSKPRTALLTTMTVGALTVGAFASGTTLATASGDGDGGGGGGGENAGVDPSSSCFSPDQKDKRRRSSRASGNPGDNNVHNDACFLDQNNEKVDGPASFQSFGAGYISACPDPDGAGPKYAVLSDLNNDGRKDLCFQSGYQETGAAGDDEFHARMNKNTNTGRQSVVWCADADADGCSDEDVKDDIKIKWIR